MEETKSSWPRTLTQGGKTFKGRVDNPVVFRAYMMGKMPTLGITGAYIEDIDVTTSKVALPYSWGVKNLFGRGSTAAAVAAAEAAAVSLLVLNVRNQGASLTAHVRSRRTSTSLSESALVPVGFALAVVEAELELGVGGGRAGLGRCIAVAWATFVRRRRSRRRRRRLLRRRLLRRRNGDRGGSSSVQRPVMLSHTKSLLKKRVIPSRPDSEPTESWEKVAWWSCVKRPRRPPS